MLAGALKYDEEDVYSLYLGLLGVPDCDVEALLSGKNISSPLREGDDSPSLSIYMKEGCLKFKDFGDVYKGDCLDFAIIVENRIGYNFSWGGYNRSSIIQAIEQRFEGQGAKPASATKLYSPKESKVKAKIGIISSAETQFYKDYWSNWDISKTTRDHFNVVPVKSLFYDDSIVKSFNNRDRDSLCIAYQILDKYKIYQPFSKEFKWRNNFEGHFAEGLLQLVNKDNRSDTLVITKAMKEVMFYYEHGIDAVAATSESKVLDPRVLIWLHKHYKKIIVALDNDKQGRKTSLKYQQKGYDCVFYSKKNITDLYETDKSLAIKEMEDLIYGEEEILMI